MPKQALSIAFFLCIGLNFHSYADTVKVLEWNITGSELNGNNPTNQSEATNIFSDENADIITLQETGRGADEIAAILDADYDLAVLVDGQEIWIIDNGRFEIEGTGTWAGQCNGRSLYGAMASFRDLNSDGNILHVYSAHFCIPDTFVVGVDTNPAVSNEDQQEHICEIVSDMEGNATTGRVLIGADFNNINIPSGESIISFLEGTGTLNAGFCTETTINMTHVVSTDVTHIMGTGGPDVFSSTGSGNPAFGQHGYVVASVDLGTASAAPVPGFRAFSIDNLGGVSLTSAGSGETVSAGYARIQPSVGTTTPSGVAIFGFTQNGILVSEAGIPTAVPIQEGRIFAEVNGPVTTGLAIANPDDEAATISFYFTDMNGTDFGGGSFTLGASEQIAKFLSESPFNSGDSVFGTFTFMSSVPVAVVALRGLTNERSDFLITTLPVSPLTPVSEDIIYFPHFADGAGWSTEVILVNPTDTTITGSVEFLDPGTSTITPGQPVVLTLTDGQIGSTFDYSIPPRSSERLRTTSPVGTTNVGSVRIVRSAGSSSPSGVGIFSFVSNGVTVSEAGVLARAPGSAFRIYVETSGTPGQPGSIRSGVAITNTSSAATTATFELADLDGVSTALTGSLTVPSSGQIARFVDEIFPTLATPFSGILRVTSSSSDVAVIGLRGRTNKRGDFLITTTPPSNEGGVASSAEAFFTHIADSGGWTTQFILFNGTSGQGSSGTLSFVGQDGQVLELSLN